MTTHTPQGGERKIWVIELEHYTIRGRSDILLRKPFNSKEEAEKWAYWNYGGRTKLKIIEIIT